MNGRDAIVVAARRTPLARMDGDLAGVDAQTLAAAVIRAVSADVTPQDVVLATATGPGGNLARRALLDAGLPTAVPGVTVDRQCGGGLDAILMACAMVRSGLVDAVVAGGAESASTSPMRDGDPADTGARGRRFFPRSVFSGGGHADPGMAESAELVAAERGVTRERQDAFAARSHRRAVAARAAGVFDAELVAVDGVTRDSCPRPTLDAARCARFPPVVRAGGTVTAANASQIADGAAAVLVMSRDAARAAGLGGLVLVDGATAGTDPLRCGLGAVDAVQALRRRDPSWSPVAAEWVAMTEAFAAQVVATVDALGLDPARVNPHGGAVALGHPWGASGAVQVVRLFHDLAATGGEGLAMAAIAGGMGTAARFRREERA